MSDVQIKPGYIEINPFLVSKKAAEFRQEVTYKGSEEFVHLEFPVKSPWLYVLPAQLTLGGDSGKTREKITIVVQPTHPTFPKDKNIKTEIQVKTRTPTQKQVLRIPVFLRDIRPIPDFEGVFAMDFGTSSTCCAFIRHDQKQIQVMKFKEDGWPPAFDSVGSLLYFADHSNPMAPAYEIGFSAMQAWRGSGAPTEGDEEPSEGSAGPAEDAPLTAFKYSVKRYLGTGKQTYVLNRSTKADAEPAFYDYEQLAGFVIQRVLGRAEEQLGGRIKAICATYPTTFSTTQLEALQRVYRGLGYENEGLNLAFDESNAATIAYFADALENNTILVLKAIYPPPSYILNFDFGGGTLDITASKLEIVEAGSSHEVRTELMGVAGSKHIGGDNITLEIYRVLKAKVALFIAEAAAEPGDVGDRDAYARKIDLLRQEAESIRRLLSSGKPLGDEHKTLINAVLPTTYELSGSGDERSRRHFFELWDAADHIKKQLGTPDATGKYQPEYRLDVPLPWVQEYSGVDFSQVTDIAIKAAEYEPLIEGRIRETLEKAKRLLPPSEPLALAILSGNSSRLPIVRTLVQEILRPVNIHFDPVACKTAVAKGACFARRNELVPAPIKYKLGSLLRRLPWDVGWQERGTPFECFFERGATLPTAEPYPFEPQGDTRLLHIYSRLSQHDDKPEDVGYFDFTKAADGKPMPPEIKKTQGKTDAAKKKARAAVRRGPKAAEKDAASALPPIWVWLDADRNLFAEKDGKSFALIRKQEEFPPEVDPFSGVH